MSKVPETLEEKKARLERLKKEALDKKNKANASSYKATQITKGQGGKADDINELMNKAFSSSSAFEERKKKEFEEVNPPPPKPVNVSMTIALDQWEHSIVPSRIEYLNQEIQCEAGKDKLKKDESSEDEDVMPEMPTEHIRRSTISKRTVDGMPMVVNLPATPSLAGGVDEKHDKDETNVEPEKPKILTKDEVDKIQESADFVKFFNKASRLVERGLFSEIDVIGSFERLEVEEGDTTFSKDKKMTEKITFLKDNPVRRAVTNLEWSHKHKELFLCSYYSPENEWDQNETNGLVNIFSTQMPAAPEITLTWQSEITSCIFHPIEPYLVVGGTFSGNVIVWDMREKRNYPIVKTPTADSIMIKGIRVVGSQNANNIVTVSNNTIVRQVNEYSALLNPVTATFWHCLQSSCIKQNCWLQFPLIADQSGSYLECRIKRNLKLNCFKVNNILNA